MTRIEALATLAALMGLSPQDAVALPTVITVAAQKVRMTESAFVTEAVANRPLREYLAGICGTAAKSL